MSANWLRCAIATLPGLWAIRLIHGGETRWDEEQDSGEIDDDMIFDETDSLVRAIDTAYLDDLDFITESDDETHCLTPPVMWTRGFSRVCCNVYVKCYGPFSWAEGSLSNDYREETSLLQEDRHESLLSDESKLSYDWALPHLSQPHAKVYVPSLDMREFVHTFEKLPSNASVTLVTGQGISGVPRELWGEGRPDRARAPSMPYRDFIADPRLNHWFVQNYDLTGCMPWSDGKYCSKISEYDPLAQKVTPIPLGIDLHTHAEKLHDQSVKEQLEELYATRNDGTALFDKIRDKLFMPFKDKSRDHTDRVNLPDGAAVHWTGPRSDMWKAIANDYMFVCAPFGNGADCHRLWEILLLGSVPVVRTSSLDRLYEQFPVIIVDKWDSVTKDSLPRWEEDIRRRFGEEPFNQATKEMLGMKYWIRMVGEKAKPGSTSDKCLPTETGELQQSWNCPAEPRPKVTL
eukprot:gnl/TRDRNA2_/TRDRNA2_35966_c0_seq1.p1 gnl/TRDRNA2_/TRDRNA2_35966_c0~~gnl/TRDRNA2_/TRDRNA2_35966_c0_seq1.p1  ORF type:complete len:460 (-),score=31.59 gnl/TRDRNA2_/TRDRNA2_35966_c0_seq1:18-1397(-)